MDKYRIGDSIPCWVSKAMADKLVFEEDTSSFCYLMGARYRVISNERWILLREGDYLLRLDDGRICACSKEAFEQLYGMADEERFRQRARVYGTTRMPVCMCCD